MIVQNTKFNDEIKKKNPLKLIYRFLGLVYISIQDENYNIDIITISIKSSMYYNNYIYERIKIKVFE
jgi:hypothetical protein